MFKSSDHTDVLGPTQFWNMLRFWAPLGFWKLLRFWDRDLEFSDWIRRSKHAIQFLYPKAHVLGLHDVLEPVYINMFKFSDHIDVVGPTQFWNLLRFWAPLGFWKLLRSWDRDLELSDWIRRSKHAIQFLNPKAHVLGRHDVLEPVYINKFRSSDHTDVLGPAQFWNLLGFWAPLGFWKLLRSWDRDLGPLPLPNI